MEVFPDLDEDAMARLPVHLQENMRKLHQGRLLRLLSELVDRIEILETQPLGIDENAVAERELQKEYLEAWVRHTLGELARLEAQTWAPEFGNDRESSNQGVADENREVSRFSSTSSSSVSNYSEPESRKSEESERVTPSEESRQGSVAMTGMNYKSQATQTCHICPYCGEIHFRPIHETAHAGRIPSPPANRDTRARHGQHESLRKGPSALARIRQHVREGVGRKLRRLRAVFRAKVERW
jgi:hypothetical protein